VRFLLAALMAFLAFTSVAGGSGDTILSAHGVALTMPVGWHRVAPAGDGPVSDPRTLLVVGTPGAAPKPTQCQIAAYRVPTNGAVVVVLGWKTAGSGGGRMKPGRAPLKHLISVRGHSFECFAGRGAVADLTLGVHSYQVNVMVGDRATRKVIDQALAIGRSFTLADQTAARTPTLMPEKPIRSTTWFRARSLNASRIHVSPRHVVSCSLRIIIVSAAAASSSKDNSRYRLAQPCALKSVYAPDRPTCA
jgi:hypothetical protein